MTELVIPPVLTDKLDAVNILLQVMGVDSVSSLDTTEDADVGAALQALDEFDLAVQSEGWSWNRDDNLELSPDVDGFIARPQNTLSIVRAYSSPGGPQLVERAGQIYNKTDHTYILTETVFVDIIYRLEWEELPEPVRRYITIWAAQQLQARLQTSTAVDRITDDVVSRAKAICGQREDEAEPANSVMGNASVYSRLHGRARRRFN